MSGCPWTEVSEADADAGLWRSQVPGKLEDLA